jgi:aspartyl-tRNA(Asn)/glutamyl-tRNA(Gln) amidotransferase subunit C
MAFTPEDIRRLSRLARIRVDAQEAGALGSELSGIFSLIDQLRAVDTDGVEPLAHPLDAVQESAQRMREDRAAAAIDRAAHLANAPQTEGGLFLVPRVIE